MEQQLIFDEKPIIGLEHVLLGLGELTDRLQSQGGLTQKLALESEFIMGSRDLTAAYQGSSQVVERYNMAMENIFTKVKDVVVTAIKKLVEFLKKLWVRVFEPKFMKIRRLKKLVDDCADFDDLLNKLARGNIDVLLTTAMKEGGEWKRFISTLTAIELKTIDENTPKLISLKFKTVDDNVMEILTHDRVGKLLGGGLTALEDFRDKWHKELEEFNARKTAFPSSKQFSNKEEFNKTMNESFELWTKSSSGVQMGALLKKAQDTYQEMVQSFEKDKDRLFQNLASESMLVNLTSTSQVLDKMIINLRIWSNDAMVRWNESEAARILKDLENFNKHLEHLEKNPKPFNPKVSASKEVGMHSSNIGASAHNEVDKKFIEGLRILVRCCNDIGGLFAYVEHRITTGYSGLKKVYLFYAALIEKVVKLDLYKRLQDPEGFLKNAERFKTQAAEL